MACALDDIMLLYHRASGQTHMMISPVPEILELLDDEDAVTAAQLHARLDSQYALGDRSQAMAELEGHLEGLTALGLVLRS